MVLYPELYNYFLGLIKMASGNSTDSFSCPEPDPATTEKFIYVSWLFENVFQTIIGVIGIIANSSAIPILCSKEMSSIFNRLLVLLAVFDNMYIILSILEAMRKWNSHNDTHEYAFAYGLYQLHSFVLCGSIFLTVSLALDRYR